jgi:hypothetical protein
MILEAFYYTTRAVAEWFQSNFSANQIHFLSHLFMICIFSIGTYFTENNKRRSMMFFFFFFLVIFVIQDKICADETPFDNSVNEKGLNFHERIYYHHKADYNFGQALHFMKLAERSILIELDLKEHDDCINMFSGFVAVFASSPQLKITVLAANLSAKYIDKKLKNYYMVNYYLMAADHYLQMYNFHCDILRTE